MPFGSIRLNNKEVVYGRFIKQIPEFKKKTGVDEIRFTEDKRKGKEDFLTCGAFGSAESVIAALDLMRNEAGCRNSLVGIDLFNWNDSNVKFVMFQSRSPTLPPFLLPSLPPSLNVELEEKIDKVRTELEEKIDKIRNGAKKRIKELEETIVKNKSESDQTIKVLQNKIERVCKLTDLSRQDQKQLLGEELFPKVQKINRVQAGKLTGMLLEQENSKLTRMLDDDGYLTEEINKALNMLKRRK